MHKARITGCVAALAAVGIAVLGVEVPASRSPAASAPAAIRPGAALAPGARLVLAAASSAASGGATAEEVDPISCFPAGPAAGADPQPLPEALQRYAARIAQRLRATGRPVDLAISTLLGDVPDWNQDDLVAQVGEVANAASLSTDPQLYRLALMACDRALDSETMYGPGAQSCQRLDHERLALIDPDNAVTWLESAAAARDRSDRAAEAEALYRATNTHRYALPAVDAAVLLLAALPKDDPAWLRYGLVRRLMEAQRSATGSQSVYQAAAFSRSCGEDAFADSNRLQLCDNLAKHLLEGARSPEATLPGLVIAIELGWSADTLRPHWRTASQLLRSKNLLPTLPEAACGGAVVGLTILSATTSSDPEARMREPGTAHALDVVEAHRARRPEAEEAPDEPDAAGGLSGQAEPDNAGDGR